jgi:RND superfamily putative drug exporter
VIIVLVFSGFVAGQLLVIKQTGVSLAVAIAVDAPRDQECCSSRPR